MRKLAILLSLILCVGCNPEVLREFDPDDSISVTNYATLANTSAFSATYVLLSQKKPDVVEVNAVIDVVGLVKMAVETADPQDISEVIDNIITNLPAGSNTDLIRAIVPKAVRTTLLLITITDLTPDQQAWVEAVKTVVTQALNGVNEACSTYKINNLEITNA